MNILQIGGSGFVSGTLARAAVARGHQVWAVTRGQKAMPEGVKAIVADRRDRAAFAEAIAATKRTWDLVVDCIGYEREDAEQDVQCFRDRAKCFVFISTDFVFDPAHRRFPQPAESEHYLTEGYGGKKRLCELEFIRGNTGNMRWTVLRPCHIYGPGSQLGCLPTHGRDPELIRRLREGETLRLVGGGHFLQQPIHARDLAEAILSVPAAPAAAGGVFCIAGPDIIESREYYRILAERLGVPLKVEELPVDRYRAENPERRSFLCHRIYDLTPLRAAGIKVPAIPIAEGLAEHLDSLRSLAQ